MAWALAAAVAETGAWLKSSVRQTFSVIQHGNVVPAFECFLSEIAFGAPSVSFLWHNVIGALTVVFVGMGLSTLESEPPEQETT